MCGRFFLRNLLRGAEVVVASIWFRGEGILRNPLIGEWSMSGDVARSNKETF